MWSRRRKGMLTKSFIIFVCTFDFYQKGRHIYRFENLCTDDTSIRFGDETIKVVLNTKGTLNDVSDEMLELLSYIDNGQVNYPPPKGSGLAEVIQKGFHFF